MTYSGIIIAGGKSSRMGFDKSQIVFQQKSFLQNAINLLQDFCNEIIISSNQKTELPFTVIKDEFANIGPISGIYSCLKNISNSKAIVIPVDMPLLSRESIAYLIKQAEKEKDVCIYQANNRLQSLVGIYDKSILITLEKQIKKGDFKLRNLIQKTNFQIISNPDFAGQFQNFNTPDQLDKLRFQ